MTETENETQALQAIAYQGAIFHSVGKAADEYAYYPNGLLLVGGDGRIVACGDRETLSKQHDLQGYQLEILSKGQLILPGLIDMHVHLPQFFVTGRQEENLLVWLERNIFAEEAKFSDRHYAEQVSDVFFQSLLSNGTTTACVFLTSHTQACYVAFERAALLGNRVIMGLNLMDINGPDNLLRNTTEVLADTEALYQQWHGKADGRLRYAWMPRFALTSSETLLEGIGKLRAKYPDAYLHTHISEQIPEIEAVKAQFPWAQDYTAVYKRFGLLAPKTILAHGVHLSDTELDCINEHQAGVAHCPSSNFFLKSGRFPWLRMMEKNVRFGMGSDVGAGPELSILKALKDAQFTQENHLIPLNTLFYTATLGAAKALHLEDEIGNLLPGKQADFIIADLDGKSNLLPNLADSGIDTILASLVYMGDDRLIQRTVVSGRTCYKKQNTPTLKPV